MDVAVVVPSWNGRRWLPGLFASLRAQTLAPGEIVVVDNGSTDGTLEWLAGNAPEARVVELGRNTGFAAAANQGMRDATASASSGAEGTPTTGAGTRPARSSPRAPARPCTGATPC